MDSGLTATHTKIKGGIWIIVESLILAYDPEPAYKWVDR
jgi:hypothetical protein